MSQWITWGLSFFLSAILSAAPFRLAYRLGFTRGCEYAIRQAMLRSDRALANSFREYLEQHHPLTRKDPDAQAKPDHRH